MKGISLNRRNRILMMTVIIAAAVFLITGTAHAETKILERQVLDDGDGTRYTAKILDGTDVFCIDPRKGLLQNGRYELANGEDLIGDEEAIKLLQYIGAVGYGYKGDNSAAMASATQLCVWEMFGASPTPANSAIEEKYNAINERLDIIEKEVSFANQCIILDGYGKKFAVTLEDENQVFQYYLENQTSGIHIDRENNSLILWAEEGDDPAGELVFDCLYKSSSAKAPVFYRSLDGMQNLMFLGAAQPKQMGIQYAVNEKSEEELTGESIYRIEHYKMDLNGKYKLADTESGKGQIGSTVTAVAKNYSGFQYKQGHEGEVTEATISGGGKTVLKLYYDREQKLLSFDGNGQTNGRAPSGGPVLYGSVIQVEEVEGLEKEGYQFDGWSTKKDGSGTVYNIGSKIVVGENMKLYAVWVETVEVSFDSRGGDVNPETQIVKKGSLIQPPADPVWI